MRRPGLLVCLLGLAGVATAGAQDLGRRLESGPDAKLSLTYATRPDVCGSALVLRIGGVGWVGDDTWWFSRSEGTSDGPCERRPARALVTRAEGRIVSVRVGLDGSAPPPGVTDLGPVPAALAGHAFLDLAARLDGRAGREALLAAVVADSAATSRGLLEIARNGALSRGLRESAASWLGREVAAAQPADASELARGLATIARDRETPIGVRTRAIGSLSRAQGRLPPELVELAGSDEPAIARAALGGLGRSDDPQARALVRQAATNPDLPTAVRAEAIKALGGRDASPADVAALRGLWPKLESRLRGSVLEVVAATGGGENARWLMAVAGSDAEPAADRARAVRAAERAGVGVDELVRLYDQATERQVRQAIIEALARIGTRTALAKIERIAQSDTDPALRRVALRRLAANGGDEAAAVLEGMVVK